MFRIVFISLLCWGLWASVLNAQSQPQDLFTILGQETSLLEVNLPRDHSPQRLTGHEFIKTIDTVGLVLREEMIENQILLGNIPDSLRFFKKISYRRNGHKIDFFCLPDYLSVGNDSDYVRMPMNPFTAQRIAEFCKCSLPTSLLVDVIAAASQGALDPFPFRPLGDRNTWPITFEDNNNVIMRLFSVKGYHLGMLVSGLKKDVILSNKMMPGGSRVVIYGWHYPNGTWIQNPTNVHVYWYVDYSHGIRLIHHQIYIDGIAHELREVLQSDTLFQLVSKEERPLSDVTYHR